jgi:dienelactone hydrolase
VAYLQARPDVDPARIGAVGLSMGGEEAIGAAATNAGLRAVVAEGATGRDFADTGWRSGVTGTLTRLAAWTTYRTADMLSNASPPIGLRDGIVAMRPRPVLLIAGRDELRADRHLAAGSANATLWELPDTPHTAARREHPRAWEARVVAFLERALVA